MFEYAASCCSVYEDIYLQYLLINFYIDVAIWRNFRILYYDIVSYILLQVAQSRINSATVGLTRPVSHKVDQYHVASANTNFRWFDWSINSA